MIHMCGSTTDPVASADEDVTPTAEPEVTKIRTQRGKVQRINRHLVIGLQPLGLLPISSNSTKKI